MKKYILSVCLFSSGVAPVFNASELRASVLDVFETREEKAFKEVFELIEAKSFEAAENKFRLMNEPIRDREKYGDLGRLFSYLKSVDSFKKSIETTSDVYVLTNLYQYTTSMQSQLVSKPLNLTSPIVTLINDLIKETSEAYFAKKHAIEEKLKREQETRTEEIRKDEERRRQEIALEQKADALEQKKLQDKIQKRKESHKSRRESAEKKVKALGLKGIYPVGISKFLYDVSDKGNLEKGLNYVFWNEVSDQDRKLDKLFRSIQKVDGHILYFLSEWTGREQVTFTIMVKPEKERMFLESQKLNYEYLKFAGNVKYTNAMGTEKTVPYFEEIKIY